MKKKELVNYNSKKTDDLKKEVLDLKLDFEKISLNIRSGKEKNMKKGKNIRKRISQIMTVLNARKNVAETEDN